MRQIRHLLAALFVLALTTIPAAADTRMIMQEGTGIAGDGAELPEGMREAFANQEPTTAVYWIAEDRAAWIGDSGSMISRLDRGEAYSVNDQTKSYSVIEMGGLTDPSSASVGSELAKSGETRKIGSWHTVRYDMTVDMGGETTEIVLWVSDEVDVDLSAYHAYVRATAAQPGFDWMLNFLEVDGFPVRQEFKIGPILSWQQLVSVSEEAAPKGTYDPPAGYIRGD